MLSGNFFFILCKKKLEKLLTGKTALITGASKGIGRGIAIKLAQHGADIAFTYLSSVEKGAGTSKGTRSFKESGRVSQKTIK